MKQVLQNLASGETSVLECPAPQARPGQLLVNTTVTLISTGTERMLVDFGRSGLIAKARAQPDKVRQVLAKARTDGLLTTIDAVRSKLNESIPLGYCNVGRVHELGAGVSGFEIGDRVVSNGPHADVVSVPVNLAARIPDGVSDETASFAVLGSIGLQGVRLAEPTIGEAFVVIGVGTIGLLTVQVLRANGCRVLAIDFDAAKLALAERFGAETCDPSAGEDPVVAGLAFSRGIGVDGVIITASTKSSDPVTQAAQMCRKRGRIVMVGVTGLDLNRADFYEKELSFQVSCSYGPGRYDPAYEEEGHDYPVGFVRWTEKRNIEAVLDLMAAGLIDVEPLISRRVPFEQAADAYDLLAGDKSALGIVLIHDHPVAKRHVRQVALGRSTGSAPAGKANVGFIGAGNYASRILIPAFRAAGATLRSLASAGGTSSVVQGAKGGFATATSDSAALIADPAIDTVVVATRPNTHARFAGEALKAGKHVFVEKPLALTLEQLEEVRRAHEASGRQLMVGFNRRFAPLVVRMKQMLDSVSEPKSFVTLFNAGAVPADSWLHDPAINGGRIIGEACHHIDLMRFLVGAPIVSVQARRMGNGDAVAVTEDKAVIVLGFADGSFGTIHYLANGAAAFPKERIEVFVQGRTLQLDNFLKLRGFSWPGFRRKALLRQDKGQQRCVAAFLGAMERGAESPIPPSELFEVAEVSIAAAAALREQH